MIQGLMVLSMVFLFVFGFFVMDKIDKLLALPEVFPYPNLTQSIDTSKPFVLLFGYSILVGKLSRFLEIHNIDYLQIEDMNELDKTGYFSHLYAVSESDLDNLMISIIADRMMEIKEKVALCNCINNKKIFEQNNIRYLYEQNITAETLFYMMFPNSGEEGVNAK